MNARHNQGTQPPQDHIQSTAWYAVHTRSNFEYKARERLTAKFLEVFLPTIKTASRRRDRKKIIELPLFRGYLFVNVDLTPDTHLAILKSAGVVNLVGINGRPVPVRPDEIANLMLLDGTSQPVEPHRYLKKGDQVMIMEGPLKGLVGIYLRRSNPERVIISTEILRRAVAVEVDGWALEKING